MFLLPLHEIWGFVLTKVLSLIDFMNSFVKKFRFRFPNQKVWVWSGSRSATSLRTLVWSTTSPSPFRSSSALVATVVPILIHSIKSESKPLGSKDWPMTSSESCGFPLLERPHNYLDLLKAVWLLGSQFSWDLRVYIGEGSSSIDGKTKSFWMHFSWLKESKFSILNILLGYDFLIDSCIWNRINTVHFMQLVPLVLFVLHT